MRSSRYYKLTTNKAFDKFNLSKDKEKGTALHEPYKTQSGECRESDHGLSHLLSLITSVLCSHSARWVRISADKITEMFSYFFPENRL